MANDKKYAGIETLRTFLDNLKDIFAPTKHEHLMSDISDYTIDSQLDSASVNPVQNAVITAELDTIKDTKAEAEHGHNYYGVCSTGASTAAKTVTIDGFKLVEGAMVIIKFENANSASNPTLNVNGTGAYPMYRYGTTVISTGTTSTGWIAGAVQVFVYDGASWIRDYWSNSTYSNASLGQGYATCSTAADTVAKTASMSSYALITGGIVAIKFTNDVCANATLNIASKGAKAICYKGAAITDGIIKAGDIATFIYSTNYHLLSIDRWNDEFDTIRSEMTTALEGKANANHTHDEYETKEDAQVKYDTITEAKTDWNQNDETAIDYVKNRTHWVEQVTEVMLEEQDVISVDHSFFACAKADLTDYMSISECDIDQYFTVTVNGVKYKCTSWHDVAYEANTIFIGDSRIWG